MERGYCSLGGPERYSPQAVTARIMSTPEGVTQAQRLVHLHLIKT